MEMAFSSLSLEICLWRFQSFILTTFTLRSPDWRLWRESSKAAFCSLFFPWLERLFAAGDAGWESDPSKGLDFIFCNAVRRGLSFSWRLSASELPCPLYNPYLSFLEIILLFPELVPPRPDLTHSQLMSVQILLSANIFIS